ncbi:hypothetical protein V8E55_007234 [Tylopilus felleus]
MRSSTVFSLALVAATVAPAVMSIPLVGRQLTQPALRRFATDTAIEPALKRAPESPEGLSDSEDKEHPLDELLGGLLARSSPEPTHFCLMINAGNGKACDTAQCRSGGGRCNLNSSTNRCNMSNMRGKSAPIACLGCGCKLEKS